MGPYARDVEFAVTVGTCLFIFLCVACAIECYLEARKGKR